MHTFPKRVPRAHTQRFSSPPRICVHAAAAVRIVTTIPLSLALEEWKRKYEKRETASHQTSQQTRKKKKLLSSEGPKAQFCFVRLVMIFPILPIFACLLASSKNKKSSSSRSLLRATITFLSTSSPNLLDLGRPAINALALAADLDIKLGLAFHAPRALHERVVGHAACVGALGGHELEHGQ